MEAVLGAHAECGRPSAETKNREPNQSNRDFWLSRNDLTMNNRGIFFNRCNVSEDYMYRMEKKNLSASSGGSESYLLDEIGGE